MSGQVRRTGKGTSSTVPSMQRWRGRL